MPSFEDVKHAPRNNPKNRSAGHEQGKRRRQATRRAAIMLTILGVICLGLTACGGGSSGSSSNSAATTSAATGSTGTSSTGGSSTAPAPTTPGTARGHFAAIRECLQKNGITLPRRTPGSAPPPGTSRLGLPKGVTAKQYEAAVKKCGGGRFAGGGGGFRRVNNPAFRQALSKYAECLRQNGIAIPSPNTSGKGPIFSTKGIDTSSAKFRAATMKCRASLVGAFRRPQGAAGAPGSGAPPTGGTAKSPEASR